MFFSFDFHFVRFSAAMKVERPYEIALARFNQTLYAHLWQILDFTYTTVCLLLIIERFCQLIADIAD